MEPQIMPSLPFFGKKNTSTCNCSEVSMRTIVSMGRGVYWRVVKRMSQAGHLVFISNHQRCAAWI